MLLSTRIRTGSLALVAGALLGLASLAGAASQVEHDPYPNDLSPAGLRAAASIGDASAQALLDQSVLPAPAIDAVRGYVREMQAMGLKTKKGRISFDLGVPNIRANDPAQVPDRIGEAQSEVSVCVNGDTVVVAWNDSRAFTVGSSPGVGTLSGFAYSTDGGASFVDGGSTPRALVTDQVFGDTDIDTDGRGNWYCNSIYTRTLGNPGPTAQQNISVHNGTFVAGVLVWNTPVMASIGTSATGVLDKCFIATDRASGNVYVAYTRFVNPAAIEIVRSIDAGATWSAPIILDNTIVPTSSKQSANPIVGPGGEVYVVWEKGANLINCPDGLGDLFPVPAQIAFTKSLDGGLTYAPFSVIAQPITGFMASGPGDNRERGNEFPDIAVDRSGLTWNGRIYVTYHDTAPWTTNLGGGVAYVEAQNATNGAAGAAEPIAIGMNVAGSLSATNDFDYYSFTAVQGNSYMFTLDPQGFNCGVSGTTRGMRMRLYANTTPAPTTTFSDSLLAASTQGGFTDRIIWTAPQSGTFKLRLSPASGTYPATYTLKLRDLTFSPVVGGARDVRDVMVTSSSDGGATWTVPARVNDDAAGLENRRPFIAADGLGHVHAFWHDSRRPGIGSNATLTTVFGTTSRDGGATWTPNYCVTDDFSFFSFNTIAIPNMGDYNMAAGGDDGVIAGWSDQRLSTGDIFDPATLTYTAGLGPEAYTARIKFAHTVECPADFALAENSQQVVSLCVANTGTVPDSYNWSATSANGWILGASNGTLGPIPPGGSACAQITIAVPQGCAPALNDVVAFIATPVGDAKGGEVECTFGVQCDPVVPAFISFFDAALEGDAVQLNWMAASSAQIAGFNLYRGLNPEAILERVNEQLIPLGSGGEFSFVDTPELSGTVWYRLAGVSYGGEEVNQTIVSLQVNALPTVYSFRLAGANPFRPSAGTTFAYTLPRASMVHLAVYDMAGRKVATLAQGEQAAGAYRAALSSAGRVLPAGGYVARLEAGSFRRSVRLIALP